MDASLIVIVLAIAILWFTNRQECCDFEILKTTPLSGSKLMEQLPGIISILECARLCSLTLSCAFVQYCGNRGTCSIYKKCPNSTTVFDTCSNGKPPITVSRIQPAVPIPISCEVNKYLVTGPDGVADSQLSESSFWCKDNNYPSCTTVPDVFSARYARLNITGLYGSWSPRSASTTDHIQVEFLTTRQTTGIVLTGRAAPRADQYVTSFKVLYSIDCVTFTHVQDESGNDEIFAGSSYEEEVVTRWFEQPIPARCIRMNPTSWEDYPSLRFDVLGC